MAWTVDSKLTKTWSVQARTTPDSQALLCKRKQFRAAHSDSIFYDDIQRCGVKLPGDVFATEAWVSSSTNTSIPVINIFGLAVCSQMKSLMEQLGPSTHQFVKVPVSFGRYDQNPRPYYCLVLGHVAHHQVDDGLTTMRRNERGKIEPPGEGHGRGVIVINRNETAGWHAWISADIYFHFTISDELHELFVANRIPGLRYTHLPERDWWEAKVSKPADYRRYIKAK